MISRRHSPRRGYNKARMENIGGRADVTLVPITKVLGLSREKTMEMAERKYKWEQSLGCSCGSGLPILRRIKISGNWQGFCKKCKPKMPERVEIQVMEG